MVFKKYHLQGKFIFQQLVTKKLWILPIFGKLITYLHVYNIFRKIKFGQLCNPAINCKEDAHFPNFWQNNCNYLISSKKEKKKFWILLICWEVIKYLHYQSLINHPFWKYCVVLGFYWFSAKSLPISIITCKGSACFRKHLKEIVYIGYVVEKMNYQLGTKLPWIYQSALK